MTWHRGEIACVGTADRLEHEHRVFDAAGHGAEFVERPAEGHRTGAGNTSIGRTQSGDTAAHARAHVAAAGFTADRESLECGGRGCTWAGARTRGAFLEYPRIHGLPAEPHVVERARAHAELRDENGTGVVQSRH